MNVLILILTFDNSNFKLLWFNEADRRGHRLQLSLIQLMVTGILILIKSCFRGQLELNGVKPKDHRKDNKTMIQKK